MTEESTEGAAEPQRAPDDISHLDFDPEPRPKCKGYQTKDGEGVIEGNGFNCPNFAQLLAIRSCCGRLDYMCVGCYNAICRFHSSRHAVGKGSTHDTPPHDVVGSAFSQVQFL